jgi:hypothetical protein
MATITESFNKSDSDILGPDLTWTELEGDLDIVSNKARNATQGGNHARADTSLSSSDHYAQAVLTANNADEQFGAVLLRKDNTATRTNYECEAAFSIAQYRASKRIAGSFSVIAFTSISVELSGTLKGSVEGANPATIKTYWNGVEQVSTTDSDIDSGTYAGIATFHNSVASRTIDFDNFEAGDLNATVQLLSPIQDISAGTWLPSSGSPAELWQMLDEQKSPDDDYCYTKSAGTMEVKFAPGGTPTLQTGHTIRYRLMGNGTCDALVKLKCGTTVVAQWTESNVPAIETDYSHHLDSSPSFTISDYSDLRISVEAVP